MWGQQTVKGVFWFDTVKYRQFEQNTVPSHNRWHLSDQKVILLIILYQQGFKKNYTPNFGTVGDGPKVRTSNLRDRHDDFLSLAFGGKFSHKLDIFGQINAEIVGTHTLYSTFQFNLGL